MTKKSRRTAPSSELKKFFSMKYGPNPYRWLDHVLKEYNSSLDDDMTEILSRAGL